MLLLLCEFIVLVDTPFTCFLLRLAHDGRRKLLLGGAIPVTPDRHAQK